MPDQRQMNVLGMIVAFDVVRREDFRYRTFHGARDLTQHVEWLADNGFADEHMDGSVTATELGHKTWDEQDSAGTGGPPPSASRLQPADESTSEESTARGAADETAVRP